MTADSHAAIWEQNDSLIKHLMHAEPFSARTLIAESEARWQIYYWCKSPKCIYI